MRHLRVSLLLLAIVFGAATAVTRSAEAVRTAPANPRHTGTPLLRVWRADEYGAAQLNHRLLVHPNGLVYFANDSGVLEFDGEHWRLIPMPREGAARSLAIDATGRLWVFGHDDAARLEPDGRGELRAVSVMDQLPPEARAAGTLHRAAVTADGVYARGQRRLMLFQPDGTVKTWPVSTLAGLLWKWDGTLYADDDRIMRVSPAGLEPVSFGPDATPETTNDLRVFAAEAAGDRPGEALLLTMRGPMRWGGPGTPMRPLAATSSAPFAKDLAGAGVFLADGRLALGTERSGVYIFERDGRLSQHIDRTHGLPGNRISDLALDAEGGLWVALQEGIARIDLESPFALHGPAQGLTASPRRFAAWRDQLYLSTAEGVARRDAATGKFIAIPGFLVGANRPLAIGERLVAATRGLREITADDQSRPWTPELIGPIVAAVRAPGWIYAGSSAGLWLLRPDVSKAGWETVGRFSTLSLGFDDLLDRGDGWLWAVARSGEIVRVDFRNGPQLDAPSTVFTPAEGVPVAGRNDRVQLLPIGTDLLAIGTDWVRRYDGATNRFEPEPRLAHAGAVVRGAQLAGRSATGGAWLRPVDHAEQLLRAEAADGPAWQVTERSIAPLRGIAFDSVFEQASTRTLWLAGQGVLASIDLAWRPARPPAALRVMIRRVETQDGAVLAGDHPATGTLRLAPEENALRIVYAAPAYAGDHRGHGQTVYRTRLEGLDRTWSAWTTATHRDFTNLPYHALHFHVEARTPDRPTPATASLALIITPPWWLTPWAWAGYFVAAGGAIYGGFKFRTRALHRRNAQLEAIVAARTGQLERINQELTDAVRIVSHDLRGPVSGIRALARQLRATPHIWASPEGPEFLGEIERTSGAAVDLMARLLDLQRAHDRAAGLAFAPADVGAVVTEICAQLAPAAAHKRIALHLAAPPVRRVIDAESVASITANLVANALKFLPADGRGTITVTLAADDRVCRLIVADNGPGIPPAERATLFEKFVRGRAQPTAGEASTGLGLYIVQTLVTAMGGTIEVGDTPGGGATFTATWPARAAD